MTTFVGSNGDSPDAPTGEHPDTDATIDPAARTSATYPGYPSWVQLPTGVTSASQTTFYVGDTSPARAVYLVDASGRPIDLTGCTVQYNLYSGNNTVPFLSVVATVNAPAVGFVIYSWAAGDLSTAGSFLEEWVISNPGGVMTCPAGGKPTLTVLPHGS